MDRTAWQYAVGTKSGDHYWKHGYYRDGQMQTYELLIGPLLRATRFADVEGAAFTTNSGGATSDLKPTL